MKVFFSQEYLKTDIEWIDELREVRTCGIFERTILSLVGGTRSTMDSILALQPAALGLILGVAESYLALLS